MQNDSQVIADEQFPDYKQDVSQVIADDKLPQTMEDDTHEKIDRIVDVFNTM